MDPFENIDDVGAPNPAETIDLSEFESSGDGAPAESLDNNQDMGMNQQQQQIANKEETNLSKFVDEFDEMEDERDGFNLDETSFPTGDENREPIIPKAAGPEKPAEETKQSEEDQLSVDQINKALGTNFKTLDEAKAFGKEEPKLAPAVTKEEEQLYSKNTNAITYLKKALGYKDDHLIREQLTSLAIQENQGKPLDQEQQDDIDLRIERLKDNGTDMVVAENIRNKIAGSIARFEDQNKSIDQKKITAQQQETQKNKQALQQGFKKIFSQGKFLNVDVSQEDIQKSYQNVISGRFHERLNKDHNFTAELALMSEILDRVKTVTSGGSYSDGLEAMMSEVDGKPRSTTNREKTRQVSAKNQRGKVNTFGDPLVDTLLQ